MIESRQSTSVQSLTLSFLEIALVELIMLEIFLSEIATSLMSTLASLPISRLTPARLASTTVPLLVILMAHYHRYLSHPHKSFHKRWWHQVAQMLTWMPTNAPPKHNLEHNSMWHDNIHQWVVHMVAYLSKWADKGIWRQFLTCPHSFTSIVHTRPFIYSHM